MRNKILFALTLSLCLLFIPRTVSAASYYVSTTGSDNDSGTITSPWNTIQKAANTVVAGDTVLVRGGIYTIANTDKPIVPKNSGTPTAYITYKAYPGESVTIRGNYPTVGNSVWVGFSIAGVSYIDIEGFTIQGFHTAVSCEAPSHHLIVRNVTAQFNSENGLSAINAASGTTQGCDYLTFEHNIIHDNGYYDNGQPATKNYEGGGSGISIGTHNLPYSFDTDFTHFHNFVRDNIIYHNYDGTGGSMQNLTSHTDGNGVIMDMAGAYEPTLIENNVIFNNGGRCVNIFGSDNVWVVGNTCYKNSTDPYYIHPTWKGEIGGWTATYNNVTTPLKNIHVQNNILYAEPGTLTDFFPDISPSELTMQNNDLFGLAGSTSPKGTGFISSDPLFVNASIDPTVENFHLTSVSPAIDNGANTLSPQSQLTDFDGVVRPQGKGNDMGAYEYTGVQNTPTATPTSTPTPTPKPGDANGDGKVDETDYSIWLSHFGQVITGVTNGDFNGDGHADGIDYTIWLNNYTGD